MVGPHWKKVVNLRTPATKQASHHQLSIMRLLYAFVIGVAVPKILLFRLRHDNPYHPVCQPSHNLVLAFFSFSFSVIVHTPRLTKSLMSYHITLYLVVVQHTSPSKGPEVSFAFLVRILQQGSLFPIVPPSAVLVEQPKT